MDNTLLTVPESYDGPQVENPVLREWTHLLALPYGSLISVDGQLVLSYTAEGATEASFASYDYGDDIAVTELLKPFIESKIKLLRLGS